MTIQPKIDRLLPPLCLLLLVGCRQFIGIQPTVALDGGPIDGTSAQATDGGPTLAVDAPVIDAPVIDAPIVTPDALVGDAQLVVGGRPLFGGIDASSLKQPPFDAPPAFDAAPDRSSPSPVVDAAREGVPPACPAGTAVATLDVINFESVGACSIPNALYVTTVGPGMYDGANSCGGCIEFASATGKVVAKVVDVVDEASTNQFSVNRAAMDMVARGSAQASVRWRWVPCASAGAMTAAMTAESSSFGWEFVIQNYTNRLMKVEYHSGDRNWVTLERQPYNSYQHNPASGLPVQFRLTDVAGNVVTTPNLQWPSPITNTISLGVQFPPYCSY